MTPAGRELRFFAAAALVSAALPFGLSALVDARLAGGAVARLERVLGEDVAIDAAEVSLDGTLRLAGVRVGTRFEAEAVEAAVGPTALLAGRLGADEVRVRRPRLRARLDDQGNVDLSALLERARAARRAGAPAASASPASAAAAPARPGGVRRIVVTGGELVLEVEGHGEIRARGVELHPQERGVRVIAAGLETRFEHDGWRLEARWGRVGADVRLPRVAVERAALAGGTITLAHGGPGDGPALVLERAALSQESGAAGRTTRLEARVAGPATELTVELTRPGGGAAELRVRGRDLPGAALAPALPAGLDIRGARVSGHVGVRLAPGGATVDADADLDVTGAALAHDLVAREPVPVSGHLAVRARWDRALGEGHAELEARTGALALRGELELALDDAGDARAARVWLDVPELACADALAAVPAPLTRPLAGLALDGRVAARLELGFDLAPGAAAPATFDVDIDNRCRVLEEAPGADPGRLLAAAPVHTLPDGTTRTLAPDDPDFVALGALPRHVVHAFVAGEDARFFLHRGFDEEQLRRSFEVDVQARRVERGGSTISQQLAKNLFLTRERTLGRKVLEAVLTWRLEARVPKARLLEVYVNVIELGEGVYGLEPAARRWFGKPAARLTVAEAAFLAALTPAPVSTDRRLRAAGKLDPHTRERVTAVLRSMRRNRLIDDATYARALRDLDTLPIRIEGSAAPGARPTPARPPRSPA
jgi:hypothetical protein